VNPRTRAAASDSEFNGGRSALPVERSAVSRPLALAIVVVVWAAIYLPGLGTLEIKGEEGRRILPAVTMLQTGNYVVPQVGSEPYFRKPPLVNWLVAASFKVFGKRNEWTARLPSALCVLAVALAFVTMARRALGPNGSLIGALVWMTNFGVIEKGRLIEIEALYVSLCGLAMITWLAAWEQKRSPWITWTVPFAFLGLGLLAKGPVLLIFFYAVAIAILYRAGELRALFHVAHVIGIVLMLAIFAAWAIPCLQMMQDSGVAHTWSRQFSGRLTGEDFKLSGWLMNIPRGLCYFLPWTPLLILANTARFADERRAALVKGLVVGMAVSFLAVSILPGSLARYTMPLLPAAAWLVAMLLTADAFALPKWLRLRRPTSLAADLRLPAVVTVLAIAIIALYAFALMPFLQRREKVRTIAAQINAALPAAEPLYAIDPDYQPFLFYVRDPIVYVDHVAEVPVTGRYLLVQKGREDEAIASAQWQPLRARPVLALKDYRNKEVVILQVGDGM
jgi:4-amino-4-deoxy-L-arabinose transferase-like glycosyltransferase